ncbi:MAG: hypothetical protein AAFN77_20500 [Planctomycetota bacterium]
MSLFDFFFPQQATASHLRDLKNQQARQARIDRFRENAQENLEQRVEQLERDMGELALVLASLIEVANENDSISREELKQQVDDLDIADGFRDGQLHVRYLRKWTADE